MSKDKGVYVGIQDKKERILIPNQVYLDISGQPFNKTIVGCVGLADNQRNIFSKLRENGKCFLTQRKLRATSKDKDLIKKYVRILNDERVPMVAVVFSNPQWVNFSNSFKNFKKWDANAFAYLYFEAFRKIVPPRRGFSATLCQDAFFDIHHAIDKLHYISKSNRYHPAISIGQSKYVEPLRLADIICRATRYLQNKELEDYDNLTVISNPSDVSILNRLFSGKNE